MARRWVLLLMVNLRTSPPLFIGSTPIDQYLTHSDWCVTVANPKAKMTGKVTPENHKPYADWAYHVQRQTQQALNHMVQRWVKKTGLKDVIITGGYGLECCCQQLFDCK